jgi:hypothetical protein
MKVRESGMPEREQWESFFDPTKIIRGKIFAFDIEPEMISFTNSEARKN